ncbi:hypothetical protein TVAG_239590 [Trichomonas vaginalis G3]|uniref:Uncharacterized protein n=1 Tax=Trichomonas vaginalis (strain ATCC PRA-98 / G3) TaxID=412133 RepID=A2DGI6_TRIV3|nr:hypothetical protein TVAGG3_0965750 [Trichomonas vaginalis G3]EAY20582.1 hypothetical protein TVAG_239590 [Trichomonas vaginalis G3]KAI5488224.1 hypothetical protein TVAGG3_0965750 [Trichomonas vaginalis G3]|eukprot:XP_001581568.1 hypothetical protein [Trichomonas vaginalis G3]
MNDITNQQLQLAEKYISTLADKEIIRRYYDVKNKLLSDSINTNRSIENASKSYSRSKIGRETAIDGESVSRSINSDDPNEPDSICLKLHEVQKKIITGQLLQVSTDPLEELETLKRVVQAKIQSLSLVRNKIRDENIRLTNDFKELSAQYNAKLSEVKENGNAEFQKIVDEETALNDKYSIVESELEDLREEYDSLKGENEEKIKNLTSISLQDCQSDNQLKKLAELIQTKRREVESLQKNIEKMQQDIEDKSKSLSKKKYGTDDEKLLEEVVHLTEQIDLVKSQNAQIELKLKKYPILVPETTSPIDIDEDEMARQILFNNVK